MDKTQLRVLIVEDSLDDVELVVRLIEKGGYSVYHERVDAAEQMRDALKNNVWNVIISDYSMPGFTGINALEILKECGLDIPFILVSGKIDEETAMEAMGKGAVDYIMKNNLSRLVPAIIREVKDCEIRKNERRIDSELKESEEKFRLAFDNANTGMCLVDLNGNFTKVNDKLCEILGYRKEELEGINTSYVTYLGDKKTGPEFIKNAIDGKSKSAVFEKRYIHKDGRIVWGQVSSSLVHDVNDAPLYFIIQIQDITKRKKAEEKLMTSEEKYRTLFEDSKDPIWTTSYGGVIIDANQAAAELLGYSKNELIGLDVYGLYVDPGRRGVFQAEVEDKGFVKNFQTQWKTKDGRQLDLLFDFTIWKDNDGKIIGYRGIAHDITQNLKSQKQLEENLEYFAHLVDHIRNPLAIMSGFIQVDLEKEKTKERLMRQIDRIEELIKQLDQGWMDTEDTRKFLKRYM